MAGWNPWRALRALPNVIFELDRVGKLGGGAIVGAGEDTVIIAVDPDLDRIARNHALGHELGHIERGVVGPGATAATLQLEEERVRRITCLRLVPPEELDPFIDHQVDVEGGVTPGDVADQFEVPVEVARLALSLAITRRRWAA